MICRYCGLKTDTIDDQCSCCSHDSPVELMYISYSNDSIISKLSSALDLEAGYSKISSDEVEGNELLNVENSCSTLSEIPESEISEENLSNSQINNTIPHSAIESDGDASIKTVLNPTITENQINDLETKEEISMISSFKTEKPHQKHNYKIVIGLTFIAGLLIGLFVGKYLGNQEVLNKNPTEQVASDVITKKNDEEFVATKPENSKTEETEVSTTMFDIACETSAVTEFTDEIVGQTNNDYVDSFTDNYNSGESSFSTAPENTGLNGAVDGILREKEGETS